MPDSAQSSVNGPLMQTQPYGVSPVSPPVSAPVAPASVPPPSVVTPAPISPAPVPSPVPQATVSAPAQGSLDQEDLTLLDTLISQNSLTPPQAVELKNRSALEGKSIEEILTNTKMLPEEKIAEAKARVLGVPYISLATTSFSPQAISLLPRAVVERFALVPFFYDERAQTISVAMANPVDLDAIEFVRQKTGMSVRAFAASPTDVQSAINQQYRQALVGEVGAAIKENEEFSGKKRVVDSTQIAQLIKEAPIAKIVSTILEFAVTSRSSDIHIEPQEDHVRVRYRIDGILSDKLSLPKNVQEALVSRIKILSDLKIDEHRTPQDGRFNFKIGNEEVDLRISILPTVNGEKIVMRLLRKSGGIPTMQDLGLNGLALKHLEDSITRPHGIILVTGPTGSGKTTTLYAILSKLNTPKVNIMSLEDPVEYQIAGVNQVQINTAIGLTFASGLRAFLRQDPNIILVGEIRDKETTDLALQAALTGHLVFSTLHTQTASGALPRLLDLGAESFLLASTITAIVGQRIVRKICSTCKETYVPSPQILATIKQILGPLYTSKDEDVRLYRGKGCNECGGTGYKGRVGIYEVLPVSDKIGQIILSHPDSVSIEKQAVLEGMTTMMQDGYLKVLKGVSSIEEVLRVAKE